MKLGVITVLFGDQPLNEALAYLKSIGIEELEVGAGGYPGKGHCDPAVLLKDERKLAEFRETIETYGMPINAFGCHGNPVHPDKAIREKYRADFHDAILLAEKLGIRKIIGFSGCPGDCETSRNPNWVTCPWPNEYYDVLQWQWEKVLIPYWKEEVKFAEAHGIEKIALEMHPGFCVYNPETLLHLRSEVGKLIGANLDPSHLIWQGIDPVAATRALGDAIYHVHAKDTKVDRLNVAVNGVLDTKPYADELHRAWVFRSVGYGNDMQYWRDFICNLRLVGYVDILSIEHEDSIMTNREGLEKAAYFLKQAIIREPKPTGMWWV